MVSVTREEFEVRSELEAVHLPTGAVFQWLIPLNFRSVYM